MSLSAAAQSFKQQRRAFVKKRGKRILRRLDAWLAQQSTVPDTPVFDSALFPWADELRDNWRTVQAELDALRREELPAFQEIQPDQYKISPDRNWRTFVFVGFGERTALSRQLCPETARMLENVPGLETAFFSILAPGKHVPRHKGVTKGLLRCHLGLHIPKDSEHCSMEVGGVRFEWKEGEAVFFDDTFPHEVTNDTDEERAVLLFDFERPMTRRGRWVRSLLLAGLRRTAFFRDALRNQREWEAQYRQRVLGAEA